MFKKIKEFIEAFKVAYNTINVNKFNAKKAINNYSREVKQLSNVTKTMKDLYNNLRDTYIYFPIDERQDFIQKTLDLLSYGRRDNDGGLKDICGWYALYSMQTDYMKTKLKELNKLYKEGKYSEIIYKVKEYNEQLEEFNILYSIMGNQTEKNV